LQRSTKRSTTILNCSPGQLASNQWQICCLKKLKSLKNSKLKSLAWHTKSFQNCKKKPKKSLMMLLTFQLPKIVTNNLYVLLYPQRGNFCAKLIEKTTQIFKRRILPTTLKTYFLWSMASYSVPWFWVVKELKLNGK